MVFLTSLDILDTGFLDATTRSQLPVAQRVNSGVALRLKGANLDLTYSGNLDKGVSPGNFSNESHPLISINPTNVEIRIILNSNNIDTSNPWGISDMALVAELCRLPHTMGLKAIYYPVDITAVDTGGNNTRKRNSQILHWLGSTDTSQSQGDLASITAVNLWTGTTNISSGKDLTDVKYIFVRFEPVKFTQLPKNKVEITISGVVSA